MLVGSKGFQYLECGVASFNFPLPLGTSTNTVRFHAEFLVVTLDTIPEMGYATRYHRARGLWQNHGF